MLITVFHQYNTRTNEVTMVLPVEGNKTYTVGALIIEGQEPTRSFSDAKAHVVKAANIRIACVEGPVGSGVIMPHVDDDNKLAATIDFGNATANCVIEKNRKGNMIIAVESL